MLNKLRPNTTSNLKTRLKRALLSAFVVLISGQTALAAGESYYYTTKGDTKSITAEGGSFAAPTTFALKTDGATSRDYAGSVSNTCNGTATAIPLSLSVKKADNTAKLAYSITQKDCFSSAPDAATTIAADKNSTPAATASAAPKTIQTCDGGVMSWILCPVFRFLLDTVRDIETKFIVPFLKVDPIGFGKTDNIVYTIWNAMRVLTSGMFVLIFLVAIFSNITSLGISNYSLKKLLPRLIAAAIAIQFSYLIVSLAIDITNLVGGSLHNLILIPFGGGQIANIDNANGIVFGVGGLAVGISAVLAIASGLLTGTILFTLIAAFFSVIGVFLTLVARQILITLMVMLAPLAIAAWVLPNTNQYFKMWHKALTRLLAMYPIIILLFTSGEVFSIATTSASGGGLGNSTFRSLISIIAAIIPLFLVPATFKFAGTALSAVGGVIGLVHGRATKALDKNSTIERARTRANQRRNSLAAGQSIKVPKWLGGPDGEIGGGRLSTITGQGLAGIGGMVTAGVRNRRGGQKFFATNPTNQDVRALTDTVKDTGAWSKRLTDEGMSYEGYAALSKGMAWADKEIADLEVEVQTAITAGQTDKAAVLTSSLNNMRQGKTEAGRYQHNNSARTAALKYRSSIDVLDDDDFKALKDYTNSDSSTAGKLVASQNWRQAREGSRKTNVHLAFKDLDGKIDNGELYKFLKKKGKGAWVEYTLPAIQHMAESGVLHELVKDPNIRKNLIGATNREGGPSMAGPQEKLVLDIIDGRIPYDKANIQAIVKAQNDAIKSEASTLVV